MLLRASPTSFLSCSLLAWLLVFLTLFRSTRIITQTTAPQIKTSSTNTPTAPSLLYIKASSRTSRGVPHLGRLRRCLFRLTLFSRITRLLAAILIPYRRALRSARMHQSPSTAERGLGLRPSLLILSLKLQRRHWFTRQTLTMTAAATRPLQVLQSAHPTLGIHF